MVRRISALCYAALLMACGAPTEQDMSEPAETRSLPAPRDGVAEDRFALLALDCVHREYPNKISHMMESDADARPPRALTPAFYGCFDWHSAVHGHWLLVRILKTDPDSPMREAIQSALGQSFTEANIDGELAYYSQDQNAGFERPYGIAWFLQLVAELEESEDPQLQGWRETLRPLEDAIVGRIGEWLPNLAYPIRIGTHNQTAFAFGLMLDYARTVGNADLEARVAGKARAFHLQDRDCPLGYEPSGEDFLSPCLMEADLMRRVLPSDEFAAWLSGFLPQIPETGAGDWLAPGVVLDPSDGKLVHLDGVNLSRAWAMEGIAAALPPADPRIPALRAATDIHRESGIAAVSAEHYEGSHWLASFATYLTTGRGIGGAGAPR